MAKVKSRTKPRTKRPPIQKLPHTAAKLARELRKIGLEDMAKRAERGWYHDWLSPLDHPAITLANDLASVGTEEAMKLRHRHAYLGEFDAPTSEIPDD